MKTHCLLCDKPLWYHPNEKGKTVKRYHGPCRKTARRLARKPNLKKTGPRPAEARP